MPLYEYQCGASGRRFEAIRKFSDPELDACAVCGKGPVARLLSSPAIQFKGSGWYVTDYSSKGKSGAEGSVGESKAPESSSADATTKTGSVTPPAKPASSEST